jgi:hypothetical protein
MSEQELERLTRGELDARAAKLGITAPEELPNKSAVVEAIVKATGAAGESLPRSQTARGTRLTRTARKARLMRTRRARGQL